MDILSNLVSSHHESALSILLNWMIFLLRNVQVPLVGAVSVGVKPARMVSRGVGAPP